MTNRIQALTVAVVESSAGELRCDDGLTAGRSHFTYAQDLPDELRVALNMPTSERAYTSEELLPAFEQNLPEMDLSRFPQEIWKSANEDPMGILLASSGRRIGRLRLLSPAMDGLEKPLPVRLSREELASTTDGDALFESTLRSLTDIPGISGIQPKLLITLETAGHRPGNDSKALRADTHILKANHPRYNGATVVEALCLDLAEQWGLEVPRRVLSGDGRLLAIERFDLDAQGQPLGFDEDCPLQNKQTTQKYDGTLESVADTVGQFTSAQHRQESLKHLFRLAVMNNAVRNGDGHLKNFGLLYKRPSEARMSPVYDVLTTVCLDGLAHDAPALSLCGRKQWDDYQGLRLFGERSCGLTRAEVGEAFESLAAAMQRMLPGISHARERYPVASGPLWRMRAEWLESLENLDRDRSR